MSVFDIFKIGIGPSSSHTVGPMVAAAKFLEEILHGNWPRPAGSKIDQLKVSIHGSLAFTGKGHATDRAIVLGLAGEKPDEIDGDNLLSILENVERCGRVHPKEHPQYRFKPDFDLIFNYDEVLPGHTNGMRFFAYDAGARLLLQRTYYSIGGGFVVEESEMNKSEQGSSTTPQDVPFPFSNADEMLEMAERSRLSIATMKRHNEESSGGVNLERGLANIWGVMKASVDRGIDTKGELPGSLKVKRRASGLHDQLEKDWQSNIPSPMMANDWLQVFAMAVNEENADGGKVVTAPTNGAAGVIPAVMSYYLKFHTGSGAKDIEEFLLTASAIGGLIKNNASISGAEVGCQGEIGSAAAMAAAGLAAIMGGTPQQVENAAEIALEHHLGMTCDPVGGLVQIPCIERNGMGAIKAVAAASLALKGDGTHVVSLDQCVETMRQTGLDMNERYKETSLGGLAVNVVEC